MTGCSTIRVLMYSHDTFGLGHLTRTVRIASALRARSDRFSILILTGSPVAPYLPLPPGADFVKLPSTIKTGSERYEARDLDLTFSQIRKLRAQLIRATARSFRPHAFMVDNVPLGMKGEILPTLRELREDRPDTRIILNLRDILDDPQTIRAAWERDGVDDVLRTFYDRIYILGDRSVYDAVASYGLPADKARHVGYASPPEGFIPAAAFAEDSDAPCCRVLVTAGGGGDGIDLLRAALGALGGGALCLPRRGSVFPRCEVVTGPLMDPEGRREIGALAAACGAELHEFVPDLPRRMARADLTIAMAGYNTCCEILSFARRGLLFPRVAPRTEQLLRARLLEARGLVSVLDPSMPGASGFRAAVARALSSGPRIRRERLPDLGGLSTLARDFEELAERIPARVPRAGASRRRAAASAVSAAKEEGAPPAPVRKNFWYWPGAVAARRAGEIAP